VCVSAQTLTESPAAGAGTLQRLTGQDRDFSEDGNRLHLCREMALATTLALAGPVISSLANILSSKVAFKGTNRLLAGGLDVFHAVSSSRVEDISPSGYALGAHVQELKGDIMQFANETRAVFNFIMEQNQRFQSGVVQVKS